MTSDKSEITKRKPSYPRAFDDIFESLEEIWKTHSFHRDGQCWRRGDCLTLGQT